jgi:NADH:ubiquinone oxidoreductase subunit 5 (subunit L)/multisubunit Na+/H+ antiporter MnhA subunit
VIINLFFLLFIGLPILGARLSRYHSLASASLFFLEALALLIYSFLGGYDLHEVSSHFLGLSFKLNGLSLYMLIFVLFLSGMILNYARRYMASDSDQEKFLLRFCLLISSVNFLVLSNNLLTAFIAWQGIGFFIYKLLTHYDQRPKAIKAANLKCLITRVGDASFLLAILIAYFTIGTSDYSALASSHYSLEIGFLLAIAVMTKSSLYPFHQWLPETLETPTPVSAVMHAGVINAGGFLLLRNWGLFSSHPTLLTFLAFIGLWTAFMGALHKQKQFSVKKKLAYSTQSQMGFMTFQYGIGAPAAAFFHIFAHGLFKATAFLNSGNLVLIEKSEIPLKDSPFAAFDVFFGKFFGKFFNIFMAVALSVGAGFLIQQLFGLSLGNPILLSFIEITMAQLIYQSLRRESSLPVKLSGVLFSFILFIFYSFIISYWSDYFGSFFYPKMMIPEWLSIFFILSLWGIEIFFWFFFETKE